MRRMLIAKGIDIGKPSTDFILRKNLGEYIEKSKDVLQKFGDKIILPVDLAYANGKRKLADIKDLPVDDELMDIGDRTVDIFRKEIINARTVFVNGPVGVFEKPMTEHGTKSVWQALADADGYTVVGGGDSVAATNKYGLADKMGYVCTGGGALVRFLSGEELPIVKALKYAVSKFGNERV